MKNKKIILIIMAFPILLHITVYLMSIPFAKPFIEKKLCNYFKNGFTIGKARVYLLSASIHVSNPRLLINRDGAQTEIFTAKKVKVCVDPIKLLSKKVVIRKMVFYSPIVNIERTASGKTNIKSLYKNIIGGRNTAEGTAAYSAIPAEAEQPRFSHYIKKIYVKNGRFHFTDSAVSPNVSIGLYNIKFFTVFIYDHEKEKLNSIKFKLNACANINQPSTILIDGEIESTDNNKVDTYRLNSSVNDFDITSLWPYIDKYMPMTLNAGKISLIMHLNCVKGIFDNAKQSVRLKDLKISSWRHDFPGDKTAGLSNAAIIKLIENNCDSISFDFYISGNINNLRIAPGEMILKAVDETLFHKVYENNK